MYTSLIDIRPIVRFLCMLAMCSCLFFISDTKATSLRQLSFGQVATQAVLIFEGEVVVVESRWNADGSHIQTFVTFRIAQVLKGTHISTTLNLSFVGGSVANTIEKFDGLIYPEFGEHGIYFVENISQPQLNPLVGWSQGHYKIRRHQGVDRMLTASDQPISEMQDRKSAGESSKSQKQIHRSTGNHASGLRVATEIQSALSKKEFKRRLSTWLDKR